MTDATTRRLIVLDSVMVDVALHIDALPPRGGDALAHERLVTAGGGFNILSAAARQGCAVAYAGQLGEGSFSRIAQAHLEAEGVDIMVDPKGPKDLGACAVLVEASGERTFITSPGAELTLTPEDLARIPVRAGDVVYLSGYNVVYPEIATVVTQWLTQLPDDVIVAFDPGPRVADIDPDQLATVLATTDWLVCNRHEATWLTGEADSLTAAEALFATGRHAWVVVRDGGNGCVGRNADGLFAVPAYDVVVVDTNGAGDVHNGVVIANVMAGETFEQALRHANLAASIAVSRFGPATCPTRDEVAALASVN